MVKLSRIIAFVGVLFLWVVLAPSTFAQGFNSEHKELASFLTRMYKSEPFEGVRVVTDYDNAYLLSVVSVERAKYPQQSVLNRVASVKAMSEANRYFNGSRITSDLIIRTTEKSNGIVESEVIEHISENAMGYVKELQQLTNFENDSRQVFIFYKKVE